MRIEFLPPYQLDLNKAFLIHEGADTLQLRYHASTLHQGKRDFGGGCFMGCYTYGNGGGGSSLHVIIMSPAGAGQRLSW